MKEAGASNAVGRASASTVAKETCASDAAGRASASKIAEEVSARNAAARALHYACSSHALRVLLDACATDALPCFSRRASVPFRVWQRGLAVEHLFCFSWPFCRCGQQDDNCRFQSMCAAQLKEEEEEEEEEEDKE